MDTDAAAVLARHHVVIRGQGRQTLLFAHGFGCDQTSWRLVAPSFEQRYRVITFDHIGSGHADASAYDPRRHARLEGYAEDLLALGSALALDHAVFIGHSFSGMVGAMAAIRAPQMFSSLIMIGPSACYLNQPPDYQGGFERADIDEMLDMMEHNFQGWAGMLAPTVMQHPDRPALGEELGNSFRAMDPAIARRWASAIFFADCRADLPKWPVPSLVLQCNDDAIAPQSAGEYIAAHAPDSTLHRLEASGHYPQLSAPAEVISAIADYVRRTTPQGL